jgi:chromosome segregation ATPase
MTQQALPPSVDQQLADARVASAQAQGRITELEKIVVKERARADRAIAELKTRTQDFTRLIEEAQTLMRPQAEWEQEIAELRASAGMAIERWKRSEAVRSAAMNQLYDQGLLIEELEMYISALRAACRELHAAMQDYAMDVDEEPPYKHREMMTRARAALAARAGEGEP